MTPLKNNNILQNINSRLSVQVSLTGLSFLVRNLETQKQDFFSEKKFNGVRTPEELLFEIESHISDNKALQPKFSEVKVIYLNNVYTTVPLSLFEESKASEYLKFNSKILLNDYIAHDILENDGMVVVYVPYVNINNYFFGRFGSFQYYHGITVFLKDVFSAEKHSIVSKMYLHLQEDQFDCIIVKNGKLQLCNSYPFRTPEDFIYYVLFCLEQLSLNPDTIPVFLSGGIEKDDANFEILYTYVRDISFVEDSSSNNSGIVSDKYHRHFLIKNTF